MKSQYTRVYKDEVTVHTRNMKSHKEHEVTVHLCLQGTCTLVFTRNISHSTLVFTRNITVHLCLSHSTLVFTRNMKSQYTCVYKEHEVTVHLCLQGTEVYTCVYNMKSQYTRVYTLVYKEHEVTVHSCLQVFTRNMKSQYTRVYKEHEVTVHLCLQGT